MAKPKTKGGTVSITVKDDELNVLVSDLLKPLSHQFQVRANRVATSKALDAVKKYYSEKGRDLWLSKKGGPTHGPGRIPTQWWRGVANGWSAINIKARSSEIINKAIGLSHKITGGTIKPKRAPFLTIPVIPSAHGHTVATFRRTIAPLFKVKNALVMSTPDGGIKAVFALKDQVTQQKWPGALPPEKKYIKPYYETLINMIEKEVVGK
jgi:hypothetical protein